jgi:dolichol-phosphate mannosyltransferase
LLTGITPEKDSRLPALLEDDGCIPAPTGELRIEAHPVLDEPSIRLSLVIPTYNESQNIVTLIHQLEAVLGPALGDAYELIVVDDDSPDRTWAVALELMAAHPHVRVVRRQGERGLATAVIRGWQVARGEVLGVMDADLQHPPETNLDLLAEIDRGAQLATASRHLVGGGVSDWSMFRRMTSRGAQLIGLLLLPGVLGRLSDPMSGYFMARRSALAGVRFDPLGYKILIEVVARARIEWIGEASYVFRERVDGESKVTAKLYWQYLLHLARLRWSTLPSSRLFRFCVVGATGVIVDMALLYVLSDPSMFGFGLTRSKIVAAEVALASNFLLNDAWTFADHNEPGLSSKFRRFLGFNAICSVGILLNVLLLNLLFNFAGLNRYVANAIAIAIVTVWNYALSRKLNWSALPSPTRPKG